MKGVFKVQCRPFHATKNMASGKTALSVKNPDRQLRLYFLTPIRQPIANPISEQSRNKNNLFKNSLKFSPQLLTLQLLIMNPYQH